MLYALIRVWTKPLSRGWITLQSCFSVPPDERDVCRSSLLLVVFDLRPQVEARSLLASETRGLDGTVTGLASWLATLKVTGIVLRVDLLVWGSSPKGLYIHMSMSQERKGGPSESSTINLLMILSDPQESQI